MNPPITSIPEIVSQFIADVKMFGTHTTQDKGAQEINDCEPALAYLKEMSGEEAGAKLVELLDHPSLQPDGMATALVSCLVCSLDEQPDEWFNAMLDHDSRLADFY